MGTKILIENPTNKQQLTEGSSHSQNTERKSNYFFKSDATCVVKGDELQSRDPVSRRKRNRHGGLKGTANSHRNAPAAMKTLGTFYKHTHKLERGT